MTDGYLILHRYGFIYNKYFPIVTFPCFDYLLAFLFIYSANSHTYMEVTGADGYVLIQKDKMTKQLDVSRGIKQTQRNDSAYH